MALHRDIFWIGRQWAVTGHGIQAVDQRLRGVLDVAIARLWDDEFIATRRAKPGLNLEDFDKALSIARTRYPQAGEVIAAVPPPEPPRAAEPAAAPPVPPPLALHAEGRLARFLPQWRVRR
jgi:hypothetical protein